MASVEMYEGRGDALSIREFVERHIEKTNLSGAEKCLLRDYELPDAVPEHVDSVVTRSEWLKREGSRPFTMKRAGERSAYSEERGIKFKGCYPPKDKRTFPTELTFFGKEEVELGRVPFGILTAEQAIREILGYVFFTKHGLRTNIRPLCVYTEGHGFCLVEETQEETRLESFLDYQGMKISQLIEQDRLREDIKLEGCLGTEIRLKGININRYAYEKARLLVSMNFNGGFRGLLNSNIGNDVIRKNGDGGFELFLCDFDTFPMVQVPEKPTAEFLKRFYLQSFVELAKSSLPIIDLARDSEEAVEKYRAISSLYGLYREEFFKEAGGRDWSDEALKKVEEWAVSTSIFRRTVCEIVPTYDKIRVLPDREPNYKPH
jgi:hypothetical protein